MEETNGLLEEIVTAITMRDANSPVLQPGILQSLERIDFWLQVLVIAIVFLAALQTAKLVILAMRSSKFFG